MAIGDNEYITGTKHSTAPTLGGRLQDLVNKRSQNLVERQIKRKQGAGTGGGGDQATAKANLGGTQASTPTDVGPKEFDTPPNPIMHGPPEPTLNASVTRLGGNYTVDLGQGNSITSSNRDAVNRVSAGVYGKTPDTEYSNTPISGGTSNTSSTFQRTTPQTTTQPTAQPTLGYSPIAPISSQPSVYEQRELDRRHEMDVRAAMDSLGGPKSLRAQQLGQEMRKDYEANKLAQANQDVAMRGQDIGAATHLETARIGAESDVAKLKVANALEAAKLGLSQSNLDRQYNLDLAKQQINLDTNIRKYGLDKGKAVSSAYGDLQKTLSDPQKSMEKQTILNAHLQRMDALGIPRQQSLMDIAIADPDTSKDFMTLQQITSRRPDSMPPSKEELALRDQLVSRNPRLNELFNQGTR